MSQLNLSMQLVNELQEVLVRNDDAAQDPGIASQYLCAIVGFMLGQQDMPRARKDEILDELAAFTRHVTDDIERQQAQSRQAPPSPDPAEAFGIWKPPA